MLEILIPEQHHELFIEDTNEFLPPIDIKETKIKLEHSLVSLKKWEQRWHKPFLSDSDKTDEELKDYIKCMTLNDDIDPEVYNWIPEDSIKQISDYISNPMTASWINESGSKGYPKEVITSEIIYYWMVTLNIPVEFENWHLNQLLTFIKIVNIKNGKTEKLDKDTAARQRAALNAKRRAMYKSKG